MAATGQQWAHRSRGKLCFYTSGTYNPAPTYTTQAGNIQNSNPLILDSAGRAVVFFGSGQTYRVVFQQPGDNFCPGTGATIWTQDGVSDIVTVPLFISSSTYIKQGLTFYQACASAAAQGLTLVIDQTWYAIPTSDTCAATVQGGGGLIQPASGRNVTVTLESAALTQICDASLGGNCLITSPTGEVYPEWWGFNQAVTDGHVAFTAATSALNTLGGGTLHFSAGTYHGYTNTWAGNTWLRGSSAGATILKLPNGANADILQGLNFTALDNTPQQIPETRGSNFTQLTDITLDGNKANNSSGYCARVWGMGMYWTNVVCQNGASGGLVTEYSDGSGTVYFPSNPKLGDTRAHFTNIRNYNNNGTGWLYEGPNDGVINGWIGTLNTQWGIDWEAKLLQGTVNTSGTAVTWASGSVFTGLVAGAGFQIAGTAYTISSCSSSTACTLTTSAGSQSGASYLVVFYLGTTDEFSDGNDYGDGQMSPFGCFKEGPGAGSLAWTSVVASSCNIGITMDATDGDEKMINMTVAGNSNYGIELQGTGNHFEGEVSSNGIGMILNESKSFVRVHGGGNTTAVSVIAESAGFLEASFSASSTYILNPQNISPGETVIFVQGGSNVPTFLQIPGLFSTDIGGGQDYLTVQNQTTPADYVRVYHTGPFGDGHIDTEGHGALYLNNSPLAPVYYGGSIGPCPSGAGCLTYTIGTPGVGQTQLPAASTVAVGLSYFVVDLNSPAFNTANAGGGSSTGYVYSNGAAWIAY